MQTSTYRPPRVKKQPPAPFSASAAKLIEQIQTEAREALLIELSAKDAITVLHGFDAVTKKIERGSEGSIRVSDDSGNYVRIYRHYAEPEAWKEAAHMAGYWHPSRWYGHQTLIDSNGRKWQHDLGVMVCDDFGNLVRVEA